MATATTKTTTPRKRTAAKKAPAAPVVKTPVEIVQEYAEKAVLVPVGAALVARDFVTSSVEDLVATYSDSTKREQELKARQRRIEANIRKFERRGTTARNRLERDVKKARTRLERQVRTRRTRARRELNALRRDLTKQAKATRKDVTTLVNRVTEVAQTTA